MCNFYGNIIDLKWVVINAMNALSEMMTFKLVELIEI